MASISRNALVSYSAAQMYQLVDDIEHYDQFLPWCSGTTVISRDEDEVRARISISKAGFNKSFATCNRLQRNKMIEMRLLEGPFKHLEGYWRFDVLADDACKVTLDLQFEFSSKIIGATFGPIFGQIASGMMDAFMKRAKQVYGK
ncbi:MAG: type II toxin-antitoxin system RatA family toxin [Gammaproteobacteria bacterium]|nr:type II toxin-antitoxin system RatA family toxin [Gammaproteobacteria bacterium]MCF6229181.1 type II toxin-antitoxin system RatA family toxin [Gammaproteobacteria bacterium]